MVGGEAHDPGVAATSGASEGTTVATTPEPAEPSSRSLVLLAAIHRFLGRGEGTDPTPGMLPPSPGGGEEGASTGAPTMQTSLRSSEFRADANVEETGARDPGCSGRCDDHRQRRPDRVVALSDYATHHCRYDDHGSAPGGRRGARGGGEGFRRKADGWEGDGSDDGLASANWERESGAKTEGGPSPRTPLPVAPPPVAVARVREASPARGPRMPGEWAESSVHLPAVQQSRRGDRGRRAARVRDHRRGGARRTCRHPRLSSWWIREAWQCWQCCWQASHKHLRRGPRRARHRHERWPCSPKKAAPGVGSTDGCDAPGSRRYVLRW